MKKLKEWDTADYFIVISLGILLLLEALAHSGGIQ